jgi:hypothetical protein
MRARFWRWKMFRDFSSCLCALAFALFSKIPSFRYCASTSVSLGSAQRHLLDSRTSRCGIPARVASTGFTVGQNTTTVGKSPTSTLWYFTPLTLKRILLAFVISSRIRKVVAPRTSSSSRNTCSKSSLIRDAILHTPDGIGRQPINPHGLGNRASRLRCTT